MLDPVVASVFDQIADIAALVAFAGMFTFLVLYSTFYQWTRRRAGKSILFLALSFVVISLISILALWIGPDFWLRPFWRMSAWLFGVYAVGYLNYALLYNWRDRHPLSIETRSQSSNVVE